MLATEEKAELKSRVQSFWNEESCGERYGVGEGREFYEAQARERFDLEPWIKPFARFAEGAGQRVLEVGVGMGADYLEWLKAGADAYGIDFTPRGRSYHLRSWGVGLIWVRNGLLRGQLRGPRRIVADHLESPGTKLYTVREARAELCASFSRVVKIRTQLGLGDLLTMKPSAKYADAFSQFVFKVYPRWLIRRLGHRFGGYLLIECAK